MYMRMSTDKQENSIDSQQNILEAYADTHEMKVAGTYVDEGISGRTAEKRPAFMRMIDDSAKGIFDAVLVYDSSRFARNLEESIVYKSVLKKNGVKLVSATEPTLDEDSALITDAMLGALNEMYSRKLSKSVKRGMVYNAQKGKYQTPPPYGYRKSGGVMSVVEDEAEIVKKAFEMFIYCPSWFSVAVKLNEMGAKKRTAYGWYTRDVKRMLLNPAYIGNVYYAGEVYKGEHEPIIDTEIWEKVQALISNKPVRRLRPSMTYKHWLSGLLRCAHCGGRMNLTTDTAGNKSYRCSKNANGCCRYSNFMSVRKLEKLMGNALEALISNDNFTGYDQIVLSKKNDGKLELLQVSLKKIRAKLNRHKDAYSSGIDTIDEYRENKTKCRKEEKELLKQLEALSVNDVVAGENTQLKTSVILLTKLLYSDDYDIEQKSFAVKNVVEKIIFNKNTGKFTVFYYL